MGGLLCQRSSVHPGSGKSKDSKVLRIWSIFGLNDDDILII